MLVAFSRFLYEEAAVLDFARRVEKLPTGANHHSGGAYRCFGAANCCPGECELPPLCAWAIVLSGVFMQVRRKYLRFSCARAWSALNYRVGIFPEARRAS